MYAAAFFVISAYLAWLAARVGGWGWLLIWPAASFAAVAGAYAGAGPWVFGKRPDGTIRPANLLLLLPFLLFTWGVWHVWRLLAGGPAWHEIIPGVSIARRLLPHEVPAGVRLVVDLTAEFPEPRGVRAGREYLSLPTLDGCPPDRQKMMELVAAVSRHPGLVLVHCANGSGRSGTVVAAILMAKGLAADPGEAVKLIRAARPLVRLKRGQRLALDRWAVERLT